MGAVLRDHTISLDTIEEVEAAVAGRFPVVRAVPDREPEAGFEHDGRVFARYGAVLRFGDRCYRADGPAMARYLFGRLSVLTL